MKSTKNRKWWIASLAIISLGLVAVGANNSWQATDFVGGFLNHGVTIDTNAGEGRIRATGSITATGEVHGSNIPAGSIGDASGPASSVDNTLARFDGTTGKLLQGSAITVSDLGDVDGVRALDATGEINTGGGYVGGGVSLENTGDVKAALSVQSDTLIAAGKSGSGGIVRVYPGTASKGWLDFYKISNASYNGVTNFRVDAQGATHTYTVPDAGADATFLFNTNIGGTVQGYDADLAALAGVTSAADKVPYFTGSGTADVTTLTTLARTLIANTGTTGMRSTLGVAIGTDVQAYDADLDAFAGLTSAANKMPYYTGAGTMATTDLTSTARNLLGNTTTTGMRTTLGLVIGTDIPAQSNALSALGSTTTAADKIPYYTGLGTATTTDFTSTARSLLDDTSTSAMRTTLGLAIGTDVQAYDAELAALAGLTSAADKIPYFTGSGSAGLLSSTAGGQAILNLTGVADTVPVYSSSSAVSTKTFKSGTFTPTITNGTNVAASSGASGHYLQIDNEIIGYIAVNIDPTSGSSTLTRWKSSLPVASNLGAASDLVGAGSQDGSLSIWAVGVAADDTVQCQMYPTSAAAQDCAFSFMYKKI